MMNRTEKLLSELEDKIETLISIKSKVMQTEDIEFKDLIWSLKKIKSIATDKTNQRTSFVTLRN